MIRVMIEFPCHKVIILLFSRPARLQEFNVAQKYSSVANPTLTGGYMPDGSFGPGLIATMQNLDDVMFMWMRQLKASVIRV